MVLAIMYFNNKLIKLKLVKETKELRDHTMNESLAYSHTMVQSPPPKYDIGYDFVMSSPSPKTKISEFLENNKIS